MSKPIQFLVVILFAIALVIAGWFVYQGRYVITTSVHGFAYRMDRLTGEVRWIHFKKGAGLIEMTKLTYPEKLRLDHLERKEKLVGQPQNYTGNGQLYLVPADEEK